MTDDLNDVTVPLPLETMVEYHGSLTGAHGRYKVLRHEQPLNAHDLRPLPEEAIAEYYSDGVAYSLWPEGVPFTWGERDRELRNVRRVSVTVTDDNEQ